MTVSKAVGLVSAVAYGITTAGCGYTAVAMLGWLRARHMALTGAVRWLQAAAVASFLELALHLCYRFIVYSTVSGDGEDMDLHDSPEAHWQFAAFAQLLQPIALGLTLVAFNEMLLGLFHVRRGEVVHRSRAQRILMTVGAGGVACVLSVAAFAMTEMEIARDRGGAHRFDVPTVARTLAVVCAFCLLAMTAVFVGFLYTVYQKTALFPEWVRLRLAGALVALTVLRQVFMVVRECIVAFTGIDSNSWIAIPTCVLEGMTLVAGLRFAHVILLNCPTPGEDGTTIIMKDRAPLDDA